VKTVSSSKTNRIMPGPIAATGQRWEVLSFADLDGRGTAPGRSSQADDTAKVMRERGYEAGLAEGRAAGYRAGQIAGMAAATTQREAEAARIDALCAQLATAAAPLVEQQATALVQLACAMTRKLLARELRLAPDSIVAIVADAVAQLPRAAQGVAVHVAPADADLLTARCAAEPQQRAWHIVANPAIAPGGCRVEADCGDLDAGLETRWAALLAALEQHEAPA